MKVAFFNLLDGLAYDPEPLVAGARQLSYKNKVKKR
jgi:hypothetical protein